MPGGRRLNTESFDMVFSVNALEHVYDLESVQTELTRALKPGGRIVFAVPFLYRVPWFPGDYNRPTSSWGLKNCLSWVLAT